MNFSLLGHVVARRIPMEDPVILNYIRIGYVVSQLLALGAYYYTSMQVRHTPSSLVACRRFGFLIFCGDVFVDQEEE